MLDDGRKNAQSAERWGGTNVQFAWVRVDGIPLDSNAPGLVVIPTNS